MRKRDDSRRGLAAVEFALMLPFMALLLFTLVEGAGAMHAYSSVVQASREGARMALMDGTASDIEALVQAVTQGLKSEAVTTSVTADSASNTVTVEVSYAYHPFIQNALELLTSQASLELVAQTTMPLP
ncbi:MAG: pilus assembly protein [Pseudodesulfovibrio sp.]|uniref:TadE family protein n=1 Tax=Pseudodesulfovibrio aespoeensis (strain ATCC 700646 / DSM 10631 / Aspo-2) TaxID=643562 RepID=E6VYP5_PSEA9|nr:MULTISPECIES: TadE/TadG family type IV pilus assembly protein [Pseudodesulfovibrio]MBU4192659.1 pilus assembly protein [Pseudomonadota bacterium]ADU63912.1 TadE family protein [Pseudodesulfovibrio aespoeensis Aspo-2]MBU4243591.1 pilus assembly protein [Pseudomonadota bacterium]MBU4378246.1 pilus assembly protein [Pseudomonadota bacterium]MBU4475421.1 pilus assembly protein [Pseudomonadota bacterium]